ncbi:MAG: hypothetical protein AAF184_06580 [Pseudomonadota bacterium]
MTYRHLLIGSLLTTLALSTAHGASVAPTAWDRGQENSAYLSWDAFDGSLNTTPSEGATNVNSAALTEQLGQAFVTSSGNLYSFSSPQSYTLTVTTTSEGPSPIAQDLQVQLQIGTWSFQADHDSVTLNGRGADMITELSAGQQTHPVFGTFTQYEYLYTWTTSASSLYVFDWDLPSTSTSLDLVVLDMFAAGELDGLLALPFLPILPSLPGSDVFDGSQRYPGDFPAAVPVPAAVWLFGAALLSLAGVRRRSVALAA